MKAKFEKLSKQKYRLAFWQRMFLNILSMEAKRQRTSKFVFHVQISISFDEIFFFGRAKIGARAKNERRGLGAINIIKRLHKGYR